MPDALSKNIYLTALHDRNEVLFFRVLSEHLREMIPIVNDRTVGLAMEQYHHECRRPRGVYLSIDHPDAIEEAFKNLGAGPGDIDLILATDAEQIFGIGDWGVGGIEISIGKLAIYTAAGGIDPARVIPVMLDVGTNRESLLADPMYPGNRHGRVRGERYAAFIDAYVQAVAKLFPNALLQWEDFGPGNGRRILEKYRGVRRTFSDDLQGTGAVTLAAAVSAMRICGTLLRNQRVVIFGTGVAGIGIADMLRDVMIDAGLTAEEATRRFWCVDVHGLLTSDMGDRLLDYQVNLCASRRRGKGLESRRAGQRHWLGRGGSPGAAHHADRRVRSSERLYGGDCAKYGPAYRTAHYLPAFESLLARRGYSRRSDRMDRWARVGCDRKFVHAGHAQGHHACDRPGEQCHVVPGTGPRYDCVPGPFDQCRNARGRGQRFVQPGGRAAARARLCFRISTICGA